MPWSLKRFQEARCLHFITFSCQHRDALLGTPQSRDIFLEILERTRNWYAFYITGYVVMPEHVHLLLSEPQRTKLSVAIQMLKQNAAHKLRPIEGAPFWEPRYYDFNVWSEAKRIEKLRYIHRNPVHRGLVERPENWHWSSFNHYATGIEGPVQIESQWTERKRERAGIVPAIGPASQDPHPVAQIATRVGTLESFNHRKFRARNSLSIILPAVLQEVSCESPRCFLRQRVCWLHRRSVKALLIQRLHPQPTRLMLPRSSRSKTNGSRPSAAQT